MSEDKTADEELSFGEKQLGMPGFSSARARKYRAELETLLVHRFPKSHRWAMGLMGIYLAAANSLFNAFPVGFLGSSVTIKSLAVLRLTESESLASLFVIGFSVL